MNPYDSIAALNRAVIAGDSEEIKRLQALLSANPTDEEFTSAQDEMDALLGPELSLDELRRRHPGRNDFALEDWQITYRAWLYKCIKGLEPGPMPPEAPWPD